MERNNVCLLPFFSLQFPFRARSNVMVLLIVNLQQWLIHYVTLSVNLSLLLLNDNNGYKTIAKEKYFEKSRAKRREQGDLFIVKIIINILVETREEKNHVRWGLWPRKNRKKRFKRHLGADFQPNTEGKKINQEKKTFDFSSQIEQMLWEFPTLKIASCLENRLSNITATDKGKTELIIN